MSKKKKIYIYGVIAIIVLALLAVPKLISSGSDSKNLKGAVNPNAPLPVKVRVLKFEEIGNKVVTSGTILANEEVELRSEVPGKITRIFFKEGTRVQKGNLLVKINDAELQAQLERAEYRLKLLEDKEYRQKILLQKEAISQEEYDVSLNEFNVARAEVEIIKTQIDKTEIKATFDGIIGLKNVSEGSYVAPATLIATFQNINPVKIDFSIPEKYAGQIKPGYEINFKVIGNDQSFKGKVYAIEPKIDPVTRTLKIRATYPNVKTEVIPGAFADVEVILEEIKDAIMVPSESIIPELKGQKVFLLKNGRTFPQSVETGIRTDTTVQITKGLNENDTLIISGILQIKPGSRVSISEIK